ncbi:MAG: carboxypeptidase-like regulatory domain-containing protein, partial [Chloracidobacterium sp.]
MKRLMIYLSLIMNCVLYLSAESLGQTTGTLRGVVTDPNGAVLAGAQVTLTLEGTQNTRVGASDEDGTFEFPALPIGTYRLTVEAYGFKRHEQANLEVSLGRVNA